MLFSFGLGQDVHVVHISFSEIILENCIWYSKEKSARAISHFSLTNDVQPVANGDRRRVEIGLYASVIFVDPGIQIDEI